MHERYSEGIVRVHLSLTNFFEGRFASWDTQEETKAYVISVLSGFRQVDNNDLSKTSITLAYLNATQNGRFQDFQRIGDWVLFAETMYPESIIERDLILGFGKKSYGRCASILNGTWQVFSYLESDLSVVCSQARDFLRDV